MPTNALCLGYPSILIIIPPRIVLHAYIIKLKVLLVVRRIVSWQILRMDKCYVWCIYFTRVYTSGLMPSVFLLLHRCVPFKLWVICTIHM